MCICKLQLQMLSTEWTILYCWVGISSIMAQSARKELQIISYLHSLQTPEYFALLFRVCTQRRVDLSYVNEYSHLYFGEPEL